MKKNLTLSEAQSDYIIQKIDHLGNLEERVDDESTKVKVEVGTNKTKTSDRKLSLQVTMFVPNAVIRAEVKALTPEEGIDLAEEKLRKQIERYKTKKNRRDKKGQWIPASTLEQISATQESLADISAWPNESSFNLIRCMRKRRLNSLNFWDMIFTLLEIEKMTGLMLFTEEKTELTVCWISARKKIDNN